MLSTAEDVGRDSRTFNPWIGIHQPTEDLVGDTLALEMVVVSGGAGFAIKAMYGPPAAVSQII